MEAIFKPGQPTRPDARSSRKGCENPAMGNETTSSSDRKLVVCLCAEWCGTCRDYRARFDQMQVVFPDIRFLWIDVEDEAELMGPLDVENFPTLLLASGGSPRFFGPLTPHPETLERLIRSHVVSDGVPAVTDRPTADLLARILEAKN
jgi:thioredoxin 1